jgi:hypothetical protein
LQKQDDCVHGPKASLSLIVTSEFLNKNYKIYKIFPLNGLNVVISFFLVVIKNVTDFFHLLFEIFGL